MNSSKPLLITFFLLAVFFNVRCDAQIKFYGPFSANAPVSVPPLIRGQSMQSKNIIKNGFFHVAGQTETSYKFKVVMKDGTETTIKSAVYTDTVRHATYLIIPRRYDLPGAYKDPDKRVYCNETISAGIGIATDSCWLFKVIKGKINAYGYHPGFDYNEFLAAIQIDDGPIINFTARNLSLLIKDDEEAYRYLRDKKFSDAIYVYNYNQKKKQEEEDYAKATNGY